MDRARAMGQLPPGYENVNPEMMKHATEMMGKMSPEELSNMAKMAPGLA